MIFRISKGLKNNSKDAEENRQNNNKKNDKIIELDKDQYKVE